jgi:hypothetical protein
MCYYCREVEAAAEAVEAAKAFKTSEKGGQ